MKIKVQSISLLAVLALTVPAVNAQFSDAKNSYPKNKNPFTAWNNPIKKSDPFAPHNAAIGKKDPVKPWNSPLGNNDDLMIKERKSYGLPQNKSQRSPFNIESGEGDVYPKNKSPFAAWNSPIHKDSPFAPHNSPIDRTSPFKPWNSPLGNNDDLTTRERKSYGLPQNNSRKSTFNSGFGDSGY